MNTTWEQKIESARANRRAGTPIRGPAGPVQQGEYLAAAVDAEPGLDLSLIDQFPPKMRGGRGGDPASGRLRT